MTDSADRILEIATTTVAGFPAPFAALSKDVVVQVAEVADAGMLRDLGIEDPLELTGLYEGIPLTDKSFADQPLAPDTVWLFRAAILEELAERPGETLDRLVAHVTVHEFAHHFGWSDDDIAAIDPWWE